MIVNGLGIGPLPIHVVQRDVECGILWRLPPNRAEKEFLTTLHDRIEATSEAERSFLPGRSPEAPAAYSSPRRRGRRRALTLLPGTRLSLRLIRGIRSRGMQADPDLAPRILDTALELGEQQGWDALHLHDIAATMGITLADVHRCYSDKDVLAEAWFDRAEAAMIATASAPGWLALNPRDRLFRTIRAWLDALNPHKAVAAAMLRYKLQPEHVHLQVQGVLRVSRTVQWIRETAALPEAGWRRELQEIVLTGIYLATLARWLNDDSTDSTETYHFLGRLLDKAEWAASRIDASHGNGHRGSADPSSWTS